MYVIRGEGTSEGTSLQHTEIHVDATSIRKQESQVKRFGDFILSGVTSPLKRIWQSRTPTVRNSCFVNQVHRSKRGCLYEAKLPLFSGVAPSVLVRGGGALRILRVPCTASANRHPRSGDREPVCHEQPSSPTSRAYPVFANPRSRRVPCLLSTAPDHPRFWSQAGLRLACGAPGRSAPRRAPPAAGSRPASRHLRLVNTKQMSESVSTSDHSLS